MIAEISEATRQQAVTLGEINLAVGDMDGITQQNAAMVEEVTAAVRALSGETRSLEEQIARFRIDGAEMGHTAPAIAPRRAAPSSMRRAAPVSQGNLALKQDEDDWSSF